MNTVRSKPFGSQNLKSGGFFFKNNRTNTSFFRTDTVFYMIRINYNIMCIPLPGGLTVT